MLLNMRQLLIVTSIVLFVVTILFGAGLMITRPPKNVNSGSIAAVRGESKSDNGEGGVTMKAEFAESAEQLVFEVALDTHFVDLSSVNPKAQFSLEQDDGEVITVERAESSGGEHHQEITLYFPKVKGNVRLVARDIAGVPRREIVWPR